MNELKNTYNFAVTSKRTFVINKTSTFKKFIKKLLTAIKKEKHWMYIKYYKKSNSFKQLPKETYDQISILIIFRPRKNKFTDEICKFYTEKNICKWEGAKWGLGRDEYFTRISLWFF